MPVPAAKVAAAIAAIGKKGRKHWKIASPFLRNPYPMGTPNLAQPLPPVPLPPYPSPLDDDDNVSPLILDLDGDGAEADGVTLFDHEGDGWSELTRWAGADDGVLVWDSNADGVINDGSELFGNNSVLGNGRKAAHGFAALAGFDSNGDGKVDSRDSGRDTNNGGGCWRPLCNVKKRESRHCALAQSSLFSVRY